ncbi:MAG: M20 family metallopeptidase [Bacilli bacterium]
MIIDLIRNYTKESLDELIKIRRHFHMNPELSGKEFQTVQYIEAFLTRLGGFTLQKVGKTGLIATIKGVSSGPCITLRADIDALPITEATGHSFMSRSRGVMHACGHDVHMAILLGVAKNLVKFQNEIKGTILLVFQPAEEAGAGGKDIITNSAYGASAPTAAVALHCAPHLPVGTISLKKGVMCAGVDQFDITLIGKAAHGSRPQEGQDAIVPATYLINELYRACSKLHVKKPAILTVGMIQGGDAPNIIAPNVLVSGTFRSVDEASREAIINMINHVMMMTGKKYFVKTSLAIPSTYPILINDDRLVDAIMRVAKDNFGKKSIIKMKTPELISDDFAFYKEVSPICYYLLGTAEDVKKPHILHSSTFDVDESSLYYGVLLQTIWALDLKEYF